MDDFLTQFSLASVVSGYSVVNEYTLEDGMHLS